MKQEILEVEVTSGKGSSSATRGGSGETQLELVKQQLKEREAKLRKELLDLKEKNENLKIKVQNRYTSMPVIALVGYTNVGKTALVTLFSGSRLESEDRLFQTLNTATRQIRLPNGQLA